MSAPLITGVATFSNIHTAPEDGVTGVTSASAQVFMQTLANNAKFLYDSPVNLRRVATSASLKAISGMANGEIALLVDSASNRYGLFVFFTGTPLADITGRRYAATSATGNWHLGNYDQSGATIATGSAYDINTYVTSSATAVDLLSVTITGVAIGDKLHVVYAGTADMTLAGNAGAVRCVVNDGGTDYNIGTGEHPIFTLAAETYLQSYSGSAVYTTIAAGSCIVKIQHRAMSGTVRAVVAPRTITVRHARA